MLIEATLAVARKMVAYLLAVHRRKTTESHSAQTARSCRLPTERRRLNSRGSLGLFQDWQSAAGFALKAAGFDFPLSLRRRPALVPFLRTNLISTVADALDVMPERHTYLPHRSISPRFKLPCQ
jgi:hypothetical protein